MSSIAVFNLHNEPITGLSVSGFAAGDIAGYANGGVPAGVAAYTPASLTVPRSKAPGSSATFAIGDNALVVPWQSFRGTATICIPSPTQSPIRLDDPLILLLAVNSAFLLSTRGFVIATFRVSLANSVGESAEAPVA
jgi:hypothetical protein